MELKPEPAAALALTGQLYCLTEVFLPFILEFDEVKPQGKLPMCLTWHLTRMIQ